MDGETQSQSPMFCALRELIEIVPVPSSRSVWTRANELAGLTILDVALRLDHVHRVTERLTLIDRGHMSRELSLDVDLRRLTQRERHALAVHRVPQEVSNVSNLSDARPSIPADTSHLSASTSQKPDAKFLWLPIARHSRHDLSPIDIHNERNEVVPRLTTETVSEVMIAGLIRLLQLQIDAQATMEEKSSQSSHSTRARWLVERAIAYLVRYGENRAWAGLGANPDENSETSDSDDQMSSVRATALDILERIDAESGFPFFELLTVAVRDQIIMVMANSEQLTGYYSYKAPLIPAKLHMRAVNGNNQHIHSPMSSGFANRLKRFWQRIPTYGEFRVEYDTLIPRNLNSYHVAFEVPEEISVRRFVLTTNADQASTRSLVNDLRALANLTPTLRGRGDSGKVLHVLELEDVLARVAHLGRRRRMNLVNYVAYVQELYAQFSYALPPKVRTWLDRAVLLDAQHVVEEIKKSKGSVAVLSSLAVLHEQGKLVQHLRSEFLSEVGKFLRGLARYLESADLGWDVTVDNDPRENGAHAYWRNVRTGMGPQSNQPVRARVQLALADEPPALINSVSWMLLGIVALVVFLMLIYSENPSVASNQPDAIGAVLLLVPGALLARLNIPSTHSVLGIIRVFPRIIAYSSVVTTTALALGVATSWHFLPGLFDIGASLLIALLILSLVVTGVRRRSRRALVAATTATPTWLISEMHRSIKPAPLPNAAFEPVGLFTTARKGMVEPADLASVGAREAARRDAGIAYEIAHLTGAEAVSRRKDGGNAAAAVETLEISTFGVTMKASAANRSTRVRFDDSGLIVRDRQYTHDNNGGTASGTVIVNPRPMTRPVRRVEYLVKVGKEVEPANLFGRRLMRVLTLLLLAADRCEAVFIYMGAPAAPPAQTTDGLIEGVRPSSGPSLRFELSAVDASTLQRLRFTAELARLANEYGFGLYANEGRAGTGLSYWREVAPLDESKISSTLAEECLRPDPGVQARETIAVSIVGPSQRQAQSELLQMAQLLNRHNIGCMALFACQMQQLICVHMLLTSSHSKLEQLGVPWADISTSQKRAEDDQPKWPSNFVPVLGTDFELSSDWGDSREEVVPFWVYWNVPAKSFSIEEVQQVLITGFGGYSVATASLIRGRITSSERLKGAGKISVDIRGQEVMRDSLGQYANRVQECVLDELLKDSKLDARDVVLRIAWGERWLGSSL
jgi:hypothetical protein